MRLQLAVFLALLLWLAVCLIIVITVVLDARLCALHLNLRGLAVSLALRMLGCVPYSSNLRHLAVCLAPQFAWLCALVLSVQLDMLL